MAGRIATTSFSSPAPVKAQTKSPPSSHRLPTINASQALQDLQNNGPEFISTNVKHLDSLLTNFAIGDSNGGLERGKVTEVWGPSGAGKTAIALQAAVTCLTSGQGVLWLDGATPIDADRLRSVLANTVPAVNENRTSPNLQKFHQRRLPTLSHLLALILHANPSFPPRDKSLLVIDNLNTLLDVDYPRLPLNTSSTRAADAKWASGRRYAVLGAIGAALNRLAVMANLAVVVTTGCATRSRDDRAGLTLVPGVGGGDEWETAIGARIVMFRDFNGRFAGVLKCGGKFCSPRAGDTGDIGLVSTFKIDSHGCLMDVQVEKSNVELDKTTGFGTRGIIPSPLFKDHISSPMRARKRIHDEIADSDEEDVDEYGWDDTVEDAIAAEGLIGHDPGDENQEAAISNAIVVID